MDPDDTVEIVVDDQLCIGVGQCEMLEPLVFRVNDDTGFATVLPDTTLSRSRAEAAADRCPSRAITIAEPA